MVLLSCVLLPLLVGASEKPSRNFQAIVDSGELRVGVAIFPPWVMRAKDGQLIGSEIDMAHRLAKDMGLSAQLAEYEFNQLIPALEKGEIDVIVSGMAIKPDRALKVNFSNPYGEYGIGLAANTQLTAEFSNLDEMQQPGVTIAVIADTLAADVAKRVFSKATIKTLASEKDAQTALLNGDVHAVVAANPLPKFWSLRYPDKIDLPLATPLLTFKEGLAIKKGDADFINFLNAWVVARSADAWISSTRHYWLETLDWQAQVHPQAQ
jgi:polar amino acid transport system substrate-binding protein